ncbi:MAG TPA: tRNA pseudouridine(55) synthase TruB [Candidatus Acidoferrum sp.]|nr:tRNA pseudouridine(55) synthase TruB [Candidatus Acidoferrum sp.]
MTRLSRSGVLVVDKPAGATSFDMVALLRRRLGVRRVGHAGTLDPAATGVLPLLIGEATKLVPFLADEDKEYVATIRFGVTTDTQDLTGRVLSTAAVPSLTPERLIAATRPFVGRIRQVPPMFSALHHRGRRLYELAREGVEVAREPRDVVVHDIAVEAVTEETVTLRIVCGRGTYVRTLAADLGAALGCGGAVERLLRSRVGAFDRERALPAAEVAVATPEGLWARVLPPEAVLGHLRAAHIDDAAATAFVHGQAIDLGCAFDPPHGVLRVHDESGVMLGIGELTGGGRRLQPSRILHADRPGTRVLPA